MLILAITIIICLVFFEILLRNMYPLEWNLEREHILSDYGVFLREPNMEFTFFREEFTQKIKLNSKGLRDYEYDYKKDDSVYRIAMVGDSFIEGMQIKLEETIPKRLEKKLNEVGNYEVINFGFSGYDLVPEAVLIEEEVIKYKPDMIILNYFVGNDLTKFDGGAYKNFPDDFWLEDKHNLLKNEVYHKDTSIIIRNFLRRHFMIYWLIKKTIMDYNGGGELSDTNLIVPIHEKEYSDDLNKKLNTTYSIFKFLKNFTEKNNISLIVVIIPEKAQVDPNIFVKIVNENNKSINDYDLEKIQRLLIGMFKDLDIQYIDLLPELKKANINNTFYWKIDAHFNSEGHKKAAELIYKELINRKFFFSKN